MADVDDIIARLKDRAPEFGGRVYGAAEFATLTATGQLPQVTPAAHVVPTGIRGGRQEMMSGVYVQNIERLYSVMLSIKAGDASGARALGNISILQEAIIGALAGWDWDGRTGVMTLVNCAPSRIAQGAFVYELSFFISDQLRFSTS